MVKPINLKLKILSPEKRIILVLIANICFCSLFNKFIIQPINLARCEYQEQAEKNLEKYSQLSVYDMSVADYDKLVTTEHSKSAVLARQLGYDLEEVQIIKNTTDLIKKQRIKIESLTPHLNENSALNCKEYVIDCKARGDYFSWLAFLENLQKNTLIDVRINSINANEQGELLIALQLVHYTLK